MTKKIDPAVALTAIAKAQFEQHLKSGYSNYDSWELALEDNTYGREDGLLDADSSVSFIDDFWYEVGWSERVEDASRPYGYRYDRHDLIVTLDGVEYIAKVDQEGGEGEGSHAEAVFTLTPVVEATETLHFRKSGYYASHYGFDWDGRFEQVEPYEKTVIDYRAVAA